MGQAKLRQNQQGAVALITVILLIFVFLVVTMGFLRLAISDMRQATDVDLNTRAYYAAESGIEDAKRLIGQYYSDGLLTAAEEASLGGSGCAGPSTVTDLSSDLDTKITCQIIDFEPGDYIVSANVNQAIFVPLIPNLPAGANDWVDSVKIEWHEVAKDGEGFVARNDGLTNLPPVDCWNSEEANSNGCGDGQQYAAMLRVAMIRHPYGGNVGVTRDNIDNKISYLNPVSGDGQVSAGGFEAVASGSSNTDTNVLSGEPQCGGSADFFCQLTITNLNQDFIQQGSAAVTYLRITPLYRGATIRITMYGSTGQVLQFDKLQAKIDVTAQAGDVIRRIETRIPLRSYDSLLPDDAITTADQLCKLIQIEDTDSAQDNCPTD